MNNYFFIALISILFLGACGEEPKPLEPKPSGSIDRNNTENKNPRVVNSPEQPKVLTPEVLTPTVLTPTVRPQPSEIPSSFQTCQSNLLSAIWVCTKEKEKTYKYFLKRRSKVSEKDVVNGRKVQRICELHEGTEDGILLGYAHYNRSYCVNELNKELGENQRQGFQCTGDEVLDETKASSSCI